MNTLSASGPRLESPILPLDFVRSVMVERSILVLRAWLAQHEAPNHVLAAFSAVEFGYDCLVLGSQHAGQLPQPVNRALEQNASLFLRGIYLAAEEVGQPIDLD